MFVLKGSTIKTFGTVQYPWYIVATANCKNANTTIIGETRVIYSNGSAAFTQLGFSQADSCTLSFKFETPTGLNQ